MSRFSFFLRRLSGWLCMLTACAAQASLQDEIQVYDDAINQPREAGLEMHINTTPSGRSFSDYPGEVPPRHALRITPEFSYGLSRDWEAGLYIPTVLDAERNLNAAGFKVRMKWLPLQPVDGRGWFGGVNLELSRLARRFSESRSSAETRFIVGYRSQDWLLAANPTLGFDLSSGYRGQRPDLGIGVKAARTVANGIAAGVEYYTERGRLGRPLPAGLQDNRLFLALDIDRGPWVFNIGVGRGLTTVSDRWTIKAIVEVPIKGAFL